MNISASNLVGRYLFSVLQIDASQPTQYHFRVEEKRGGTGRAIFSFSKDPGAQAYCDRLSKPDQTLLWVLLYTARHAYTRFVGNDMMNGLLNILYGPQDGALLTLQEWTVEHAFLLDSPKLGLLERSLQATPA